MRKPSPGSWTPERAQRQFRYFLKDLCPLLTDPFTAAHLGEALAKLGRTPSQITNTLKHLQLKGFVEWSHNESIGPKGYKVRKWYRRVAGWEQKRGPAAVQASTPPSPHHP